jgi:hypothetical protein
LTNFKKYCIMKLMARNRYKKNETDFESSGDYKQSQKVKDVRRLLRKERAEINALQEDLIDKEMKDLRREIRKPNSKGRPKASPSQVLDLALKRASRRHKMDFLTHFVDLAYSNTQAGIALLKKILPDVSPQKEAYGGDKIQIHIHQFDGEKIASVQTSQSVEDLIPRIKETTTINGN